MAKNTNSDSGCLGCIGCVVLIGLIAAGPPGWVLLFILLTIGAISNNSNSQTSSSSSPNPTLVPNVPDDLNNILMDIRNGEIKDPVTQETFHPGDKVHLCLVHRLAYHQDSWQEMGYQCTVCGHGRNAKLYELTFPVNWQKEKIDVKDFD